MGFLSQKIKRSQLVVGDHIYTWRAGYTYSHHGIYVGQNKVIHFTCSRTFFSSSPLSLACSKMLDCGFKQPKSGVVLSCLDCFLGTGSLYRFEYKVSRSVFWTKIRVGTCTTAESDPPKLVIHRATCLLQNGFGKHDVLQNNCEDFALYCKTGLLVLDERTSFRSGQASSVISVPFAATVSLFLASTPMGMVTATTGIYFLSRYGADIGVRTDVIKVPVEDMGLFHEWREKYLFTKKKQ